MTRKQKQKANKQGLKQQTILSITPTYRLRAAEAAKAPPITRKRRRELSRARFDLFSAYFGEDPGILLKQIGRNELDNMSNKVEFDEETGLFKQEMDTAEHNAQIKVKGGGVSSGLGRGENSYMYNKEKKARLKKKGYRVNGLNAY